MSEIEKGSSVVRANRLIAAIVFTVIFGFGCSASKPKGEDLFPGARPVISQLQKQIEWKKLHNVTRDQADEMCQRWLDANEGKSVEQFWQYAVTVTPAELLLTQ